METLTLVMVVKALAWGGSAGVVMWAASHYGDKIARFKALDPCNQRVLMIIAAFIISAACYALVTYLPDTFWVAAQPYFLIAVSVAAPILAGQGIYLARRVPPLVDDMNKIRAAGMIVPDDHPLLSLMKDRVQAEADPQPAGLPGGAGPDAHA